MSKNNILDKRNHQNCHGFIISAEAIASGETSIRTSYLSRYITSLQSNYATEPGAETWQLLQRHFRQITHKKPLETQFSAATLPCNQLKNISFDFLPLDSSRVKLPLLAGPDSEGSDYINASWVPGFQSTAEFIVSQLPSPVTSPDLWRLVWEQSVHTVKII